MRPFVTTSSLNKLFKPDGFPSLASLRDSQYQYTVVFGTFDMADMALFDNKSYIQGHHFIWARGKMYVDEVVDSKVRWVESTQMANAVKDESSIYITSDTNQLYRWDGVGKTFVALTQNYQGAVAGVLDNKLSEGLVVVTDDKGDVTTSSVKADELGFLSGVTSGLQEQLDGKASSTHKHGVSDIQGLLEGGVIKSSLLPSYVDDLQEMYVLQCYGGSPLYLKAEVIGQECGFLNETVVSIEGNVITTVHDDFGDSITWVFDLNSVQGAQDWWEYYQEFTDAWVVEGDSGKIYLDLNGNQCYRWGGTSMVQISTPDLSQYLRKDGEVNSGNIIHDLDHVLTKSSTKYYFLNGSNSRNRGYAGSLPYDSMLDDDWDDRWETSDKVQDEGVTETRCYEYNGSLYNASGKKYLAQGDTLVSQVNKTGDGDFKLLTADSSTVSGTPTVNKIGYTNFAKLRPYTQELISPVVTQNCNVGVISASHVNLYPKNYTYESPLTLSGRGTGSLQFDFLTDTGVHLLAGHRYVMQFKIKELTDKDENFGIFENDWSCFGLFLNHAYGTYFSGQDPRSQNYTDDYRVYVCKATQGDNSSNWTSDVVFYHLNGDTLVYTFTPPVTGDYYIRHNYRWSTGRNSVHIYNIQVEEGNVPSPYISYDESHHIDLSSDQTIRGTKTFYSNVYAKNDVVAPAEFCVENPNGKIAIHIHNYRGVYDWTNNRWLIGQANNSDSITIGGGKVEVKTSGSNTSMIVHGNLTADNIYDKTAVNNLLGAKVGAYVSQNPDLNSITTPGCYRCSNTVTNGPTTMYGTLLVVAGSTPYDVIQHYMANNSMRYYIRRKNGADEQWSEWKALAYDSEYGGTSQLSDDTVKEYLGDIDISLEDILRIPLKLFRYTSDKTQQERLGTSAQSLLEYVPQLVQPNEEGLLTVDYSKLSLVALTAVHKLAEKCEGLESRLDAIEKMLYRGNYRGGIRK